MSVDEKLLSDGTLHITVGTDLSKVKRVLLSQEGTHYGELYYADAQPERKKGEWIKEDSTHETVCSVCHGIRRDNRISHTNFCNCCGADMRGKQEWVTQS